MSDPTSVKILIRCDASPAIGFGHLVRCGALADELRDGYGCDVHFAIQQGPEGVDQVKSQGYKIFQLVSRINDFDEGNWLKTLIINQQYQVLILDMRTNLATEAVRSIRESGVLIVVIDDASGRRINADLAFYPPVPQVSKLDWTGFTGELFVGWDWLPLRPQFAERANQERALAEDLSLQPPIIDKTQTIIVSMGASDPECFTLKILQALDKLSLDLRIIVVIGCCFMHDEALVDWLRIAKRTYEIHRDVADMAALIVQSDLAIISFGTTAYELAVLGVPALYMCLTPDHAESARGLEESGFGLITGICYEPLTLTWKLNLGDILIRFRSPDLKMKTSSNNLISGKGAINIADVIMRSIPNLKNIRRKQT